MNNQCIRVFLLIIAAAFVLGACGPAANEAEPESPNTGPTAPALDSAPSGQATELPADYPAPEAERPPATPLPADYPAAPALPPTPDPYPGGVVWVIKPVGTQCEEGTEPGYGDLREATSTMAAAGVKVASAEMTELMVTTSCGSPTSAHYRLQIAADDLETALSMGWTQE